MFTIIIKDARSLKLLSGGLFYIFEQILHFFFMFLLFLLDNFIVTHLESTHIVWGVFCYIRYFIKDILEIKIYSK